MNNKYSKPRLLECIEYCLKNKLTIVGITHDASAIPQSIRHYFHIGDSYRFHYRPNTDDICIAFNDRNEPIVIESSEENLNFVFARSFEHMNIFKQMDCRPLLQFDKEILECLRL